MRVIRFSVQNKCNRFVSVHLSLSYSLSPSPPSYIYIYNFNALTHSLSSLALFLCIPPSCALSYALSLCSLTFLYSVMRVIEEALFASQ